MDKQDITLGILGFIALAIPIVGSLWKVFSIREQLQTQILSNSHRLNLLEQKIEHLVDQQTLFLNGLQERLEHVRDRTAKAEENLGYRLEDVEGFMEKSSSFTKRRRA